MDRGTYRCHTGLQIQPDPNLIEHTGTFPIHGVPASQAKGLKRSTAKALLPDTRTPQRSCVHGSAVQSQARSMNWTCSKSFYIEALCFVDQWNNLTCLLCEICGLRTKSYYLLNCIRQTVGPLKGFVINKCFMHVLKRLTQGFFLRGQSRFVGIWSLSCNKRLACWKPWKQHPHWLTIKTGRHWRWWGPLCSEQYPKHLCPGLVGEKKRNNFCKNVKVSWSYNTNV